MNSTVQRPNQFNPPPQMPIDNFGSNPDIPIQTTNANKVAFSNNSVINIKLSNNQDAR